ncbi:MAG: 2-phosphosulfolactate phosphatase [Bacillota bacterium]|nr:2-phosphosulfolactate phosphatase [Bacillota bacterium]
MYNLDIILTHQEINVQAVKGKTCIAIDTLRATSTIITALSHGCPEIIPVGSVTEALHMKKNKAYEDYLLGGEIEGQYIENFHLENSPLDYCNGNLQGRGIILSTTNGTRTLKKLKEARIVVICALLNAKAVAEWIIHQKSDVIICCSGRRGSFSLEDFLTAGRLAAELRVEKNNLSISDLAFTAAAFYENIKKSSANNNTIFKILKNTDNGKRLIKAGLEADIKHCSQEDITTLLPQYRSGSIKQIEIPDLKDSMPRTSVI